MSPWALPVPIVEVAFANNMSTPIASCTWTNVSADVVTGSTSTGKSDPTSTQAEAGRATIRLFNVSGRYNPFNTASPYYGPFTDGTDTAVLGLVPMKRIRIRATWAGTTYNVWHGFVEAWQMVWPSPSEAYCDVTATDGFKQLNLRVMGTVYAETVAADNPAFWARLGDAQGSTMATASIPDPSTGTPSYVANVGAGVTFGGPACSPTTRTPPPRSTAPPRPGSTSTTPRRSPGGCPPAARPRCGSPPPTPRPRCAPSPSTATTAPPAGWSPTPGPRTR